MDLSLLTSPKSKVNSIAPIMNGRFIATSDQAGFFYEMGDKRYKVNNVEFIASNAGITASTPGVNETLYFNTSNRVLYAWNSTTSTLEPVTNSDANIVKFNSNISYVKFADASWDQIVEIAESGLAPTMFKLGESRIAKDSNNNSWTIQIIGFNHDDLADGSGKAGITFRAFPTNHDIKSQFYEKTNDMADGYIGSILEYNIANYSKSLFESLGLVTSVKSVNKDTYITTNGDTLHTSPMTAFALSSTEICDPQPSSNIYIGGYGLPFGLEGSTYSYFKQSRLTTNNTDSGWIWWTRSFDNQFASAGRFAYVSYEYIISGFVNNEYGIVFGFCI